MKKNCNYHANQKAIWSCETCIRDFCNNCIKKPSEFELPKCPLCRNSVHSLSISSLTQPVIPQLLIFLTQTFTRPLGLVLWVVAILFASTPNDKPGQILFFLVFMLFVVIVYQYMRRMATTNDLLFQLDFSEQQELFNILIIYVGGFITFDIFYEYVNILTIASITVAAIFVPAFTIVRLTENSLSSSLSPDKIINIIKILKLNYLIPASVLLATILLSISSKEFFNNQDSLFISKVLVYGLILHSVNAIYLFFGYLVYHYHYELDFSINNYTLFDLGRKSNPSIFFEINIYIKEKRYDDAKFELLKIIDKSPDNHQANEKLISVLTKEENQPEVQEALDKYLTNLISSGQHTLAGDYFYKHFKYSKNIVPKSINVVKIIASHLATPHNYKSAIFLLKNYLQKNDDVKKCSELHITYAEILIAFTNNTLEAKKTLSDVIISNPSYEASSKARVILSSILNRTDN